MGIFNDFGFISLRKDHKQANNSSFSKHWMFFSNKITPGHCTIILAGLIF